MTYYKYTTGTAFHENGSDYVGFFHLSGNMAYSGRIFTGDSQALTYKPTIVGDFFERKMEYDTTYGNLPTITPYYSNTFDILNNQGLDEMTSAIDHNNIMCYKGLNVGNPTIYDFERNNNLYYGVSYIGEVVIGRQDYAHIEPFTSSSGFGFLENVRAGAVFVNSAEEFKYFCSIGTNDYVVSGSFNLPTTLNVIYSKDLHPDYTITPDYTYSIHNDYDNYRIFVVNNDYINIYDSSTYDECDNLILIDSITLDKTLTEEHIFNKTNYTFGKFHYKFKDRFHTYNNNNPNTIRFGNNIRTSLYAEPDLDISADYPTHSDNSTPYYWVYTDEGQRIPAGMGNTLRIYNKHSSMLYQTLELAPYGITNVIDLDVSSVSDDIIILHKIDSELWVFTIYGMDFINTTNIKLNSISADMDWYKIRFSHIDSNQFYIYNKNEYQSRYLSAPSYPAGRLETGELELFDSYTFKQAKERFKNMKIKFNSGLYPSNNFNIVLASETTKNNNMYMIFHNIGRLYALKQPISNSIFSIVPDNLVKYFTTVKCSESSIGIYLNSIFSNLIKDTMNILINSQGRLAISEYTTTLKEITEITFDMENMYMNGNETINVITLQRILTDISNIQSKLLPILN